MSHALRSALSLLLGLSLAALAGQALADDSEIFYSQNAGTIGPNVVMVIDTSGSMSADAPISSSSYVATGTYANVGNCNSANVYFLTANATATTCTDKTITNTTPRVNLSAFQCTSGLSTLSLLGAVSDNFIQWSGKGWVGTLGATSFTSDVTCYKDQTSSTITNPGNGKGYPTAKTTPEWQTAKTSDWWTTGTGKTGSAYTAYSGNFLNYLAGGRGTSTDTKMNVMKSVLSSLIPTLPDNWNVAIMTYNYATSGTGGVASGTGICGSTNRNVGYGSCVLAPFTNIGTDAATLVATIKGLQPQGNTPLVGSVYEAYRYVEGLTELFGKGANVATCSTDGGTTYTRPPQSSCQKNFVVLLTDGLPNETSYVDANIYKGLYGGSAATGICTDTPPAQSVCSSGSPILGGSCLSALTSYMYGVPTPGRTLPKSKVNYPIQSFFLSFGVDPCLLAGQNYLNNAAAAGGGVNYSVQDGDSLVTAFGNITNQILAVSTSFTAPTVAVNAFNRTQTLNDLYISMFTPNADYHWAGNLKHYTLSTSGSNSGQIVDSTGNPAISGSFISQNAISTYAGQSSVDANATSTTVKDGNTVALGGAAGLLPAWNLRKVYTYTGTTNPASPVALAGTSASQFVDTNTALAPLLAIPVADTATKPATVIDYALGADLYQLLPGSATCTPATPTATACKTRLAMGDSLHGQPTIVFYGKTISTTDSTIDAAGKAYIYSTDNDGFLHAIDAYTGAEAWSFVPREFIDNLYQVYQNAPYPGPPKHYTLDGSVQALVYNQDGTGIIKAATDAVVIYFGDGRGGSSYYAIDVTTPTDPKYLWTLGPNQLPNIGNTWSTPVIAKVNLGTSATQASTNKFVLIFGGGYDPNEDSAFQTTDTVGNSLYMVDAKSGRLLWQAAATSTVPTGTTPADKTTVFTQMTNAFPASVSVLDTNGDGYADRLYAADLGGQVWRFDITNATTAAPGQFNVAGGVIASLGGQAAPTSVPDQRRFYTTPDVALIQAAGFPLFFDLAIGSGYRGHPLNTAINDRFYALRDFNPLTPLTQASYNSLSVIVDGGGGTSTVPGKTTVKLFDVTQALQNNTTPNVTAAYPGWQLDLGPGGNDIGTGEKILSNATTFNNQVLFSTYTPAVASSNASSCNAPTIGSNSFYALTALNGGIVAALSSNNGNSNNSNTHVVLQQTGISPQPTFLFPGFNTTSGTTGTNGTGTSTASKQVKVVCTAGVEVLSVCKSFSTVIKTIWTENDAK